MQAQVNQSSHGFTLIELIMVLAILGVLFSFALPAFSKAIAHNLQTTQLYTLLGHHQLARSEAIKSNSRVILCKSNNSLQCTPSAQWSEGWIIFTDSDSSNTLSGDENIIQVQGALSDNLSLKYGGFGSHHYIRYYPGGQSSSNGTFTLCNQLGDNEAKALITSRTGRARLSTTAYGGRALTCL